MARPDPPSHSTIPVPVVPVPAVASVRGPGGVITTSLPGALLFQFNSATLGPGGDSVLAPIADQARRQHLRVAITGHASPDGGTVAYNISPVRPKGERGPRPPHRPWPARGPDRLR